jgi:hypothetical protein
MLDRNLDRKLTFVEFVLVLATIIAILFAGWYGRTTIINNIELAEVQSGTDSQPPP